MVLVADSPIEPEFVWTLRNVGTDHVLLGSDYPQLTLGQASPQPIDPKGRIASQIPAAGEIAKRGTPVNIFYPDPALVSPYIQQFNLNVQREVVKDLAVQIAYVGKIGRKLLRTPRTPSTRPSAENVRA